MKNMKLLSKLIFLIAFLVLSVANGPQAAAQGFSSASYFEGVWPAFSDLIPTDQDGSNSLYGSVMPNYVGSPFDTANGTGAIGEKALGVNGATGNRQKKQALYDFLLRKNQSGTSWEKMGSAFIVHQMTGRPWGSGGRTIPVDDPEWAELYARLVDNDNVRMERYDFNGIDNTAGVIVNGRYDVARYAYDFVDYVDSWVFTVDGSPVYAMEIACANPLGSLPGLPQAQYNLTPSVSPNRDSIEVGESVSVTNSVRNSKPVRSIETDWRLTKIEYSPGAILNPDDILARSNDSNPCATFPIDRRVSCSDVQRSSQEIFEADSTKTYNPVYSYTASPDTAVGTRVCFVVSVSRPSREPSPSWRHSALRCVIVAKEPKMQVWGGDIRAGGEINTSTTTISGPNRTFGSWGEYAVLSNQPNGGFASGAGLNGGNADSMQSSWSSLTFANISTSCTFGCYGFSLYAPSLTGQFASSPSYPLLNGSVDLGGLAGDTPYRANNLTITGGSIGPDKSIIIIATGTITISGDIRYSEGPYTSVASIPQVVIVAPVINISNSAGNVDAWLLATTVSATGRINTCSDVILTAPLTATICSNPLKINGPIVTDRLFLRRTAGSEGGRDTIDDPAEVFNLRADAYLWGASYGNGNGKIRTVHTKELPPRF